MGFIAAQSALPRTVSRLLPSVGNAISRYRLSAVAALDFTPDVWDVRVQDVDAALAFLVEHGRAEVVKSSPVPVYAWKEGARWY